MEVEQVKKRDGMTPTELLDDIGMLDAGLIAAHCTTPMRFVIPSRRRHNSPAAARPVRRNTAIQVESVAGRPTNRNIELTT